LDCCAIGVPPTSSNDLNGSKTSHLLCHCALWRSTKGEYVGPKTTESTYKHRGRTSPGRVLDCCATGVPPTSSNNLNGLKTSHTLCHCAPWTSRKGAYVGPKTTEFTYKQDLPIVRVVIYTRTQNKCSKQRTFASGFVMRRPPHSTTSG
jgi:hypothetical protein